MGHEQLTEVGIEGCMKVGMKEGRKTGRYVNRKIWRKVSRTVRRKAGRRGGRKVLRKVETGREKLERQAVVGPIGRTFKVRLSLKDYCLADHESCSARSLTLASTAPAMTKITSPVPLLPLTFVAAILYV